LDSSEFLKFFVIFLDKLGNNQILHNKLGQKLLYSVKLWIAKMTFLVICSSGLHLDALLLSSNICHLGFFLSKGPADQMASFSYGKLSKIQIDEITS
jgi:hypothetical protein